MEIKTNGYYWINCLSRLEFRLFFLICFAATLIFAACTATNPVQQAPQDITLLKKWSGDYPVDELDRLPAGQRNLAAGYIGDSETFIPVWRAFMPEGILPAVDFSRNIVVFSRNTQFYNRNSILKVTLHDGTAEIIAMETMSAIPIENKVSMSLAVVPRAGIKVIQTQKGKIKVKPFK